MSGENNKPGVRVYSNKNGANITFVDDKGVKRSYHSNSESNGKPIYSEKHPGLGQFVKQYDSNLKIVSQEFKPPKNN